MEDEVLRKLTKMEPFKVGDVVSVQNRTGNYNEENNVKRVNIPKRNDYDSQSIIENGARWCLIMLFLFLCKEYQGKSEEYKCSSMSLFFLLHSQCFKRRSVNNH